MNALGIDEPQDGRRAPPVPGRLQSAALEGRVHGRGDETGALMAALASAAPGAPTVAVVSGEAGIGKTRLAAEVAARAAPAGALVLYGRCEEPPVLPYQPLTEALGGYADRAPTPVLTEFAAEAREVARLVPELRRRLGAAGEDAAPPSDDPAARRSRLFGAVRELLAAASREAALLVVVDDVHWADVPTLRLLRHLLVAPRAPRALFLLTHRPDEVRHPEALADALAEGERRRRATRIALKGLGVTALAELMSERTERGIDRAEAERLLRDSGGNPFFALELIRAEALEGPAAVPPEGVRDVIRRRVAAIGPAAGEVLGAAVVAGAAFDSELLTRMTGRSEEETARVLGVATRAGLLAELPGPGLRLDFAHALVERSLREDLETVERRRLHRRAAEALDALHPGRPDARALERAQHWHEAHPPDLERALAAADRAARRLLDQREPDAAAGWWRHALELHERLGGGDDARRCELLIGLGEALVAQGDPAFRETLLDAARIAQRLGDRVRLIRAALANNRGFVSSGGEQDDERIAVLGAALDAVGEGDSPDRAWLLATLANELYFAPDRERRIALSDEALVMARRLGDPVTLSRVLTGRITIWAPDTTEQVLRDLTENVAVADVLGDPLAQFRALRWRGACLLEMGDVEEAERTSERWERLAERLGDPTALWLSTQDRGNLAIVHGDLAEAERCAERALELGTASGQPDALPYYANQVTALRWEQGRLAELQPLLAQVVVHTPGVPAFRAALALAHCEAGMLADAAALLEVETATGFAELPLDIMWLFGHVAYGHVAAELHHQEAAATLFARLEPWAGRIAWNTSVWGTVDLALGRLALALGRHDEADGRLADAQTRAEAWGAPVWRARALLEQACADLERDGAQDPERALGLLEEVAAQAGRLGAQGVARRAEALLGRERAARTLGTSRTGRRVEVRAAVPAAGPPPAPPPPGARRDTPDVVVLRLAGQAWTLSCGGRELRLEDSKGMHYLAELLARPGVERHVLELQAGAGASTALMRNGDPGAVLDAQAKAAYRERLAGLEQEIDEAERFHDVERLARVREEREAVGRELAAAVGIGGRDRRFGDPAERARVNVRRAIGRAIGWVGDVDPVLGHHLRASVRTGSFCVYDPPPSDRLAWRVEGLES